jgi:predicted dehydrogenase
VVAAFAALKAGLVGSLVAARVELELRTEWSNWEFVLSEPRVEILLHSIHYLSLFAAYLGEPESVESEQRGDPDHPLLKDRDLCSSTRLHYRARDGQRLVCAITCNHLSTQPREQWRSELILEGNCGRIVARIGDNLDYPNGVADQLILQHAEFGVQRIPLLGNRFPWAFVATMTELQRALADGDEPANGLGLGLLTMRMTEACYQSHAGQGRAVLVPPLPKVSPN